MSLFATYYALPQTQQIGSKAQSIASKTSFSFVPLIIRPDLSTQTQAQSRLMIRKSGMQSISTISIEFTYDTKKIKNLTLEPIEWARGKPPIVLKPFSTTLSGTTATASITLGAPCDEKQCYPLKRRNNGIAKLLFSPTGNAIIAPLAQSVVTLTGISENTYDHRLSRNLTVLPQQ
jgi:hypothetical protein